MTLAVYDLTPITLDPLPHEDMTTGPGTAQYWADGNIADWTTSGGWDENPAMDEPNLRQGEDWAAGTVDACAWGLAVLPDLSAIIGTVTAMQVRLAFDITWAYGGVYPDPDTLFSFQWSRTDTCPSDSGGPNPQAVDYGRVLVNTVSTSTWETRDTIGPSVPDGRTIETLSVAPTSVSFDRTSDLTWQAFTDVVYGTVAGYGSFDLRWDARLRTGVTGFDEPFQEYSYNVSNGVLQLLVTYEGAAPADEWGIDTVAF